MNMIVPEGELLRRATDYVLQRIAELNDQAVSREHEAANPAQNPASNNNQGQPTPQQLMKIVDDACMNFNLGPKDAETMLRIFQDHRPGS